VASGRPCLRDFGRASSSAPAARTDRDLAAAVAVAAVVVGVDRAVAAVRRVLDAGTVRSVLTQLQRSTLDPVTERMARSQKGFLASLRQALATGMGVEVPKLVEAKRISWMNLAMVLGSLIGLWAILAVFSNASGSLSVIEGAKWGWVALAFVLAQMPVLSNAWVVTGAVIGPIPYGRCAALEMSNLFTSFIGGESAEAHPGPSPLIPASPVAPAHRPDDGISGDGKYLGGWRRDVPYKCSTNPRIQEPEGGVWSWVRGWRMAATSRCPGLAPFWHSSSGVL
jgi:hypothetical protein